MLIEGVKNLRQFIDDLLRMTIHKVLCILQHFNTDSEIAEYIIIKVNDNKYILVIEKPLKVIIINCLQRVATVHTYLHRAFDGVSAVQSVFINNYHNQVEDSYLPVFLYNHS